MDWLLRRLADNLGVEPARAGEAITPHLRFERPWPQGAALLVVLLGSALILWLYSKERPAPFWYRMMLAALRIALVLLAMFMLAEAVLSVERVGLPYFVVMADDSASLGRSDRYEDPEARAAAAELAAIGGAAPSEAGPARLAIAKGWLAQQDGALFRALLERHKVRLYLVSSAARDVAEIAEEEDVEPALKTLMGAEANGAQSLLGTGLRQVLTELRGAPPTAILFLTDGQTTDGETIAQAAELAARKGVPLFPIGLGDPEPPRDLFLGDLLVDEVVFVDDIVRFEAKLGGRGFEGQVVTVRLLELPEGSDDPAEAVEVGRREEAVPPDGQTRRIEIPYRPKQTGDVTYIVKVEPQPREDREDNNALAETIHVRDDQLKVLLVDGQPRYEYRYLKSFLERRPETVALRVVLLSSDPEYSTQDLAALPTFPTARDGDDGLFSYDVVILGDADPAFLSASQLQNLADFVTEEGGGLIFVAGQFFNPMSYKGTPLEPLLPVQLAEARDPTQLGNALDAFRMRLTVEGRSNPIFRFGEDEASSAEIWNNLPEHFWYFEAPRKQPAAFVLAEHPEAQGADGSLPLILYQFVGAGKAMFQAVDDTWRWRLGVGDRYFGRYWIQAIRFMARSRLKDQSQAEVTTDRLSYNRNQPVLIRVKFSNPGLAPGEVNVEVERAGHGPRRLTLRAVGEARDIFEGVLPQAAVGEYTVRLLPPPVLDGELPSATFRVEAPAGEAEKVQMNRPELLRAAEVTGGRFYTPLEIDPEGLLAALPAPQKIPLDTDPPIPLWNDWRLLVLFLTILTAEWVLRKRKQMV